MQGSSEDAYASAFLRRRTSSCMLAFWRVERVLRIAAGQEGSGAEAGVSVSLVVSEAGICGHPSDPSALQPVAVGRGPRFAQTARQCSANLQ
jgi:hypothetical protein